MSKIYVASSWRNVQQPDVVKCLRNSGHNVYDFRNPKEGNFGFHWSDIHENWEKWSKYEYRQCLDHPIAKSAFNFDFKAMEWADTFVGVMPFGISASIEMGWAAGNGKRTVLLIDGVRPELMVKVFDHICCGLTEVIETLKEDDGTNCNE